MLDSKATPAAKKNAHVQYQKVVTANVEPKEEAQTDKKPATTYMRLFVCLLLNKFHWRTRERGRCDERVLV